MWQSRTLTYRERGSVGLTTAERRAYAILLDFRAVSVVRTPYTNLKSNPPQSFYGKATIFQGATPSAILDLPTPQFRILSLRNEQAATTYNQLALAADANRQITNLSELVEDVWARLQGIQFAPLLEHRETKVKIVGLPLSQFEITVYRLEFEDPVGFDFPDPDSDPTEGQDEYYEPAVNPSTNPFGGNPTPSGIPGNLDPRDFAPQDGESTPITGSLSYEFRATGSGNYAPISRANLVWPGRLVEATEPDFTNAIGWEDDDGNVTTISRTNFPPLEVRFVQFDADDGRTFIPDPNSFTSG